MQEMYVYCDIRYGTFEHYFVPLKRFKTTVSTLIQYLLGGELLIIRI